MSNIQRTQQFFDKWADYGCLVSGLDTYKLIAEALRGEIQGRVLDVGNGGVFNYDVASAKEIVAVDIATKPAATGDFPVPVEFRWGDAVKLPVESDSFDTVIIQSVIHHLAESTYSLSRERAAKAIAEAFRALKPGGRLVIMEPCLPVFCERIERFSYPVFKWLLQRIGHPYVFQWNSNTIAQFAREAGFQQVQATRIPLGKWVIHLGCQWPAALTVVRAYKFIAVKPPIQTPPPVASNHGVR